MIYALIGLLFGFFIPYLARRFQKFMPATMAYALYRIFKPYRFKVKKNNVLRQKLIKKYFLRSSVWALFSAVLSYAAYWRFGEINIIWYLGFFFTLMLLFEIDYKMFLLPDILTVPLLIIGFLYAVMVGGWVGPAESAFGALLGYLLPVVASMFLVWKHKDAFGGGDIKLLAAVGAWVGVEKIVYIILLSTIIFALYALFWRKRDGAFGPAIVVATIMVVFFYFWA